MTPTKTLLSALLLPGMLALAACDRGEPVNNDAYQAPASEADAEAPPPMDATPAADDAMMGDEMSFAELDANADGSVSMDELSPTDMLHQHFSVADADGNGMLSEAEIQQHRADMASDEAR
jgi:hypothetical protein